MTSLCRNVEVARHITTNFILVFQDALHLNTEVIYFREHSRNTVLLNVSRKHVAQSGYSQNYHITFCVRECE